MHSVRMSECCRENGSRGPFSAFCHITDMSHVEEEVVIWRSGSYRMGVVLLTGHQIATVKREGGKNTHLENENILRKSVLLHISKYSLCSFDLKFPP